MDMSHWVSFDGGEGWRLGEKIACQMRLDQ